MSDHELSGPPSSPAPSGEGLTRMATNPEMRSVDTGRWPAHQMAPETIAERALRIALSVRAYAGRAPMRLADGTIDDGTGLSKLVYGINAKLDKAIAFIESANAVKASRGKTAGELAWIVVRWVIPFALAAIVLWLSGHVSLK